MRNRALSLWLAVGVIGATVASTSAATAVSFTGLGDLGGVFGDYKSRAFAVSADGAVVVGSSIIPGTTAEAFRWTSAGGMVGLGDLPGGPVGNSHAESVSADGSVVVGIGSSGSGDEAFRWTAGGGMVGLGDLPGGYFQSDALAVSADGAVVVGWSPSAAGSEAFRWTAAGGMVGLGDLAGGDFGSFANAASADGGVVVGNGNSGSRTEAFRWTAGGGMVGLGDLPGGYFQSDALAVSADGAVVVGYSVVTGDTVEAFRWTAGGGTVGLGYLPGGGCESEASAVSGDGAVVVGLCFSASGREAIVWTEGSGMRSIRDMLVNDYDLDLTGWTLDQATGISSDGLTMVGYGTNPSGFTEGWIATIPEPNTALLVMTGLLGLAYRQRRHARAA